MPRTRSYRAFSLAGATVLGLACVLPTPAAARAVDDDSGPGPGMATADDGANPWDSLAQVAPGTRPAGSPDSTAKPRPSAPSADKRPAPPEPATELLTKAAESASPSSNQLASLMGDQSESRGSEPLAGAPNMFGDFFNNLGGSVFAFGSSFNNARADLPLAAGCRRVKIAEDDNALPQDRVFFTYNHFQDALQAESSFGGVAPFSRNFSVDCYTIGVEKTFFDRCSSIELRMPLAGRTDFSTPDFDVSGGDVGNLAVIVKRVVTAPAPLRRRSAWDRHAYGKRRHRIRHARCTPC